MQAFPDTGDNHKSTFVQGLLQQLHRGGKRCAKGITGLFQPRNFHVEDLLRARYLFLVGHCF